MVFLVMGRSSENIEEKKKTDIKKFEKLRENIEKLRENIEKLRENIEKLRERKTKNMRKAK